ncbi:MAG: hypothetical protein EB060_06660 [Proteobacteria bacterium]|nr:hypothetical protein [Pseudomonadota bacterium]
MSWRSLGPWSVRIWGLAVMGLGVYMFTDTILSVAGYPTCTAGLVILLLARTISVPEGSLDKRGPRLLRVLGITLMAIGAIVHQRNPITGSIGHLIIGAGFVLVIAARTMWEAAKKEYNGNDE